MAPGSGSGLVEEGREHVAGLPDGGDGTPPGWMWSPTRRHLVPDPRHPDHPINNRKRQPKQWDRLDDDPRLRAAIAEVKPEVARLEGAIRAASAANGPRPEIAEAEAIEALWDRIKAACDAPGPRGIAWKSKREYLVARTFPPDLARGILRVDRSTSVELFIAPDDGGICMVFWGASREDRDGYEGLIRNAQKHLGLLETNRGRPRLVDPNRVPPGQTDGGTFQAETAARLFHWQKLTQPQIATAFGWTGTPKTRRDRVRTAVREGENLLAAKLGDGWETRPPPHSAEGDDVN